jgi:hypothetical protein
MIQSTNMTVSTIHVVGFRNIVRVSTCAVHANIYMVSLPSPIVHIPAFVIVGVGQQMLRNDRSLPGDCDPK